MKTAGPYWLQEDDRIIFNVSLFFKLIGPTYSCSCSAKRYISTMLGQETGVAEQFIRLQ